MARYSDTAVDYIIQPGISLKTRPHYAQQSAKNPVKVPQWTPATAPYHPAPGSGDGPAPWRGQHVYTPKSSCNYCIQPTPTSGATAAAPSACQASTFWRKITETVTTCAGMVCAPTCLSLSTALPLTVVDAMCVRTLQTTYTTKLDGENPQPSSVPDSGNGHTDRRRRALTTTRSPPERPGQLFAGDVVVARRPRDLTVESSVATSENDDQKGTSAVAVKEAERAFSLPAPQPIDLRDAEDVILHRHRRDVTTVVSSSVATSACRNIGIQTPALGGGVTLSSDGNPCYSITITPTVQQSDTCTLDVHVTSYGPCVGTSENGIPTVNTDLSVATLDPITSSGTICTF
ncbi:uncharacterized protein LOC129591515 [Paramacrobiotus metropolitanus]|uniref:uncharacterized protein LOC129591515 n=1 Tax=Paramacrobiotus metropolitanus TaxID=2943436 RepID=UPI002446125E|nr:uncharacterized protein LOC129591515 [Paramacrobiotus metropolitanus]